VVDLQGDRCLVVHFQEVEGHTRDHIVYRVLGTGDAHTVHHDAASPPSTISLTRRRRHAEREVSRHELQLTAGDGIRELHREAAASGCIVDPDLTVRREIGHGIARNA